MKIRLLSGIPEAFCNISNSALQFGNNFFIVFFDQRFLEGGFLFKFKVSFHLVFIIFIHFCMTSGAELSFASVSKFGSSC